MWHYNYTDTLYHGNYSPAYMATDYDNSLAHYGVLGMKWGVRKERESSGSRVGGRRQLSAKTKQRLKKLAIGAGVTGAAVGLGALALKTQGGFKGIKAKVNLRKGMDHLRFTDPKQTNAIYNNLNRIRNNGGKLTSIQKVQYNAYRPNGVAPIVTGKSFANTKLGKTKVGKAWVNALPSTKAAIGVGVGTAALTGGAILNKKTNKALYNANDRYGQSLASLNSKAKTKIGKALTNPNQVHNNLNDYVYLQRKKKGKI